MNSIGKERLQKSGGKSNRHAAFTLVEVMVGVIILGLAIVSLFALLSGGFAMVRFNRDNLRATQIMLNRVEGLRLYNWEQLTTGMVPTNFSEYYYPLGTTNSNQGTLFLGEVDIASAVQTPASTYSSSMMRSVTVRVTWTSGKLQHSRQMTTYVSQYGLQNYLFNN
ncbi:MAG TPA: prepilin-type N-terminal cleavage/methylation domain-containing protein [Verrucomicrobiae bacterium]|nr:prepilin-type N-terminal cleavage/methylation domain-containing protein [Verrucomicrobiae bacterium]